MLKKRFIALFISLAILLPTIAQEGETQWEYLELSVNEVSAPLPEKAKIYIPLGLSGATEENLQKNLDILGKLNWEIVGILPGKKAQKILLKRKLDESRMEWEKNNMGKVIMPISIDPLGKEKVAVILERGSVIPIRLNCTFTGQTLFRYESDGSCTEEGNYNKGDLLIVPANKEIRIWASNGNVVKFAVFAGGKTYELISNQPGIMVMDIKWLKNEETGKFVLSSRNIE